MKHIKQLCFYVFILFFLSIFIPVHSFAGVNGNLSGSGTKSDPFQIKTVNDLNSIREDIQAGNSWKGTYFQLEANLQLPDDWQPLGCLKEGQTLPNKGKNVLPFSGHFDGNDHTLSFAKGSKPLFGYVRGAEVSNLNIYGEYIDSYGLVENYVLDYGESGSYQDVMTTITVKNVTIKSGSRIHQAGFLGGSASGANHANFSNCTIESNVIIGCNADGTSAGLSEIGSFGGALNGTITNCVSYATVYGVNNVGGIAGIRGQSTNIFTIEGCQFHGKVQATGNNVGGILGSGYYMDSAPNAYAAVVKNCTVTGRIIGKENVGGIFGAEAGIDQTWDNGAGYLVANTFSGKINGENRVGAIVGYLRSINVNNVIADNVYSSDCGVSQGFGQVLHVDTSSLSFGMHDGVFYFDTSQSSSYTSEAWNQIYSVVDSGWENTGRYKNSSIVKSNYNRSDDPLGADLEKLVKCSESTEPTCYQLDASGNYKDTYYVGEELDLTGLTLTAHWTKGKADTEINLDDIFVGPFDSSSRGQKTVRLYYGTVSTTIKVTVIKNPNEKINVTFSILGDEMHDALEEKNAHTLSMGTLQTWVAAKSYNVSANATVKDVLEKVLVLNHMSCSNPRGNYVESLTKDGFTLAELDNGSMSGWMYTLNGKHPILAVNEQYLEDGDEIIFHYTDQYYYEEGSEGYEMAKKALAVSQMINSIGTVAYTSDCQNKINVARVAYDALSADVKVIFPKSQYQALTTAESSYSQLKAASDEAARIAAAEAERLATIQRNTPAATGLTSVKKKGKGVAKITWKKVAAATGYEIYMSNKKASGYKKIATIKKVNTVTFTKKKLAKKKYFFKIRTFKTIAGVTYYGNYSNVKAITIK